MHRVRHICHSVTDCRPDTFITAHIACPESRDIIALTGVLTLGEAGAIFPKADGINLFLKEECRKTVSVYPDKIKWHSQD